VVQFVCNGVMLYLLRKEPCGSKEAEYEVQFLAPYRDGAFGDLLNMMNVSELACEVCEKTDTSIDEINSMFLLAKILEASDFFRQADLPDLVRSTMGVLRAKFENFTLSDGVKIDRKSRRRVL
jgi:hypothetical protein